MVAMSVFTEHITRLLSILFRIKNCSFLTFEMKNILTMMFSVTKYYCSECYVLYKEITLKV